MAEKNKKGIQAKHVSSLGLMLVVWTHQNINDVWMLMWDLERAMPEVPLKVLVAKIDRLIRKGYMDGCTCGCRGDFTITEEGKLYIAWRLISEPRPIRRKND